MSVEFRCPACGKKLFSYERRIRKYGSPIKECKKCGAEYIDPRFHELALDGIPEDEYKAGPYVFMIIVGALITWRGLHLFRMHQLGVSDAIQWVLPTIFTIFGVGCIIAAIGGIIMLKTGLHEKKINRLMAESQARVKDMSYINRLKKLGYKINNGFGGMDN